MSDTAVERPSMMFIQVAAATQRARVAETTPGQEKYTNWWVAKVLDAIEDAGYVVCWRWNLDNAKKALANVECRQTELGELDAAAEGER